MVWIYCKPKYCSEKHASVFITTDLKRVLIIQDLYIFRIIIIMYVHTCSHTFRYIQSLV